MLKNLLKSLFPARKKELVKQVFNLSKHSVGENDIRKYVVMKAVTATYPENYYLESVRKLSEKTGVSKSAINRAILRMADENWLTKDIDTGKYKILIDKETAQNFWQVWNPSLSKTKRKEHKNLLTRWDT